jgi:N-acetylglucosaminyldiphosphoundecaprenol N-acetyl-beta-D-mannosaminyltransferase
MSIIHDTVCLLDFDFNTAKHIDEIAEEIMQDTAIPGIRHLITPNASTVVLYNQPQNSSLKAFYTHSRYILPDGMPIVWLSRMKGVTNLHRLPGSDLFPALWPRIKKASLPSVFVLPNEAIAGKLNEEHPDGVIIVPGMFAADNEEYIDDLAKEVALAVKTTRARFVFIGLNFPKQEKLGMRIAAKLEDDPGLSVLILLLGASFEFYFGFKPRAPRWMQDSGLEWLHRFAQEPRRLWKRYTVESSRFVMIALRELSRKSARN